MRNFPEFTVSRAVLAAALLTLIVYLPAVTYDVLNLDDHGFVSNPATRVFDLSSVKWAFTASEGGWWMPIIWISFALDNSIWHGNPAGFHLTNILLHSANTALVAVIADKIYKRAFKGEIETAAGCLYPATIFLTALFFGVHPVHVESVAWISERKNVLSTFFSLASISFYLKYLACREAEGDGKSAVKEYLLSLVLLLAALMAKPLAVMLPALFLVADWYPFNRFHKKDLLRILSEKIPFFVVAGTVAVATILLASGERILVPLALFSLVDRFIISGYALFEYCRLMLLPCDMLVLWLIPTVLPLSYVIKAAVIYVGTLLSLLLIKKKPWIPAVWLCFLLMHLPSLHFFLNGACSVSAHFLYIPSIFMLIAAGGIFLTTCSKMMAAQKRFGLICMWTLVAIMLCATLGVNRHTLAAWKNSESFWTRMIEIEPAGRFYYYRGEHYLDAGNHFAAAEDFQESIRIAYQSGHPEVYTLHAFRGEALRRAGRHEEAVQEFSAAINIVPLPNFFHYRALSQRILGRTAEADDDFKRSGGDDSPIVWQYLQNRDDLKPRQDQ